MQHRLDARTRSGDRIGCVELAVARRLGRPFGRLTDLRVALAIWLAAPGKVRAVAGPVPRLVAD
jgi:hypothetical protein